MVSLSALCPRYAFGQSQLISPSSNMLYPQEDRENNTLHFTCRTCHYSEPPQSACVYRNELSNSAGETAGITQDIGEDPTVGYDFPEMCTLCGQEILCQVCGKATDAGCWLEVNGDGSETTAPYGIFNNHDKHDDDDQADNYSDPMSDEDHGEWVSDSIHHSSNSHTVPSQNLNYHQSQQSRPEHTGDVTSSVPLQNLHISHAGSVG
jgi:DNA-directed RNA polymerase II subunit RPB9